MTLARPTSALPGVSTFTPVQLLRVARLFAADPDLPDLLPERAEDRGGRRWHQLAETHHLQLWVIEWPPGASTGFHDHGGSRGAFTTVRGALTERQVIHGELHARVLPAGEGRAFGTNHVHDVVNASDSPCPERPRLLAAPGPDDPLRPRPRPARRRRRRAAW
ncbi:MULTISPECIES: cysteine dioxygenase [unclassified Knoellia]|uniref:cysteine dioxygenase n=1 Tax=Knoellia altitudinis TaxID=3404795 RepID=UPI003615E19F